MRRKVMCIGLMLASIQAAHAMEEGNRRPRRRNHNNHEEMQCYEIFKSAVILFLWVTRPINANESCSDGTNSNVCSDGFTRDYEARSFAYDDAFQRSCARSYH